MTTNILLVGFLLVFFLGFVGMYMLFQDERTKNLRLQGQFKPFTRKKAFLTGNELKLFSILTQSQLFSDYYIFPQLHLSTLLKVKGDARDMQGKFDWINKLNIDFAVFSKDPLEPALIIELNDQTHDWGSRKARDEFVRKALVETNIEFMEVAVVELTKPTELISKIESALIH
jgi:hypothetical protein